jgi:hypothetical protein
VIRPRNRDETEAHFRSRYENGLGRHRLLRSPRPNRASRPFPTLMASVRSSERSRTSSGPPSRVAASLGTVVSAQPSRSSWSGSHRGWSDTWAPCQLKCKTKGIRAPSAGNADTRVASRSSAPPISAPVCGRLDELGLPEQRLLQFPADQVSLPRWRPLQRRSSSTSSSATSSQPIATELNHETNKKLQDP